MTARPASGLLNGFLRSLARVPDRPAVEVDGASLSYGELHARASAIASCLTLHEAGDGSGGSKLTALLASRTSTAFAGVVAILMRGHGYVPLNPTFPPARNRRMLERSGARALVVDRRGIEALPTLLSGVEDPLLVVVPDAEVRSLPEDLRPHRVVACSGEAAPFVPAPSDGATPAYLLFTSGSTGSPKGVLVRQANVRAFLDAVAARYDFDETDRFSQTFDLTFDLSVFDMLAAWESGGCVCCPAERQLLKPASFVRDAALTVWFSVPSIAMFAQRLGALKPNALPSLRWSLFCGEALPAELARAWAAAGPSSVVENLYGPTEATIACTVHRWDPRRDIEGVTPIGTPLGRTRVRIVDDRLRTKAVGEPGELILAGPQVVERYWDDEQATARSFVSLDGGRWYRTGDRIVEDPSSGSLRYVGRLDNQIKVLGHRVELEEIEAVMREEAAADVIAVGWPRTASGAAGIIAFIANPDLDERALRERIAARLPDYMIPRQIRALAQLPLNANGKHDRQALLRLLESE